MAKFNMNPLTNPMPTQDPQVRNGNFNEVALGYTPEMAIDEAMSRSRTYADFEAREREEVCNLFKQEVK